MEPSIESYAPGAECFLYSPLSADLYVLVGLDSCLLFFEQAISFADLNALCLYSDNHSVDRLIIFSLQQSLSAKSSVQAATISVSNQRAGWTRLGIKKCNMNRS
jgi:hypothetical protein